MEESFQNRNDYFDDKINSLKKDKNLYDIEFINILNEYLKFLQNYKEEEKKKSDILENIKNEYKNEIILIQNKIQKVELERERILKWIFLQIKMKEKKLIMPEYYEKIIETNFKRDVNRRKTIIPEMKNLKLIKDHQKSYNIQSNNYRKSFRDIGNKNDFKNYNLTNIKGNSNNSNQRSSDKSERKKSFSKYNIIQKNALKIIFLIIELRIIIILLILVIISIIKK